MLRMDIKRWFDVFSWKLETCIEWNGISVLIVYKEKKKHMERSCKSEYFERKISLDTEQDTGRK